MNCLTVGLPKKRLDGAAFIGGGGCCRANVVSGVTGTDVANGGGDGAAALASMPAVGGTIGTTCTGLTAVSGDGDVAGCTGVIGAAGIVGAADVE